METKTVRMRSHLPNLLKEAAASLGTPGISIGFAVALGYLVKIADRSQELDDPILTALFEKIFFLEYDSKEEEEKHEALLDQWLEEKEANRKVESV